MPELAQATTPTLGRTRGRSDKQRWRERTTGPLSGGALLLASCTSIQIGSALATTTFKRVGAANAAGWLFLIAAVLLLAIVRPRLRSWDRRRWCVVALFGLSMAVNEVCFYLALDRLPLGMVVTLAFLGPLGLALVHNRGSAHLACALLALVGVLLLCGDRLSADPLGIVLSLVSGCGWAGYIIASGAAGSYDRSNDSLAVAFTTGALLTLPLWLLHAGDVIHSSAFWTLGVVAILSTILPGALELAALKRLSAATAGVLFSIEPAIGAVVGLVGLGQVLSTANCAGIIAVVVAGAIALRDAD